MEYTDGYYARHFTQEVKKLLSQSNLKITKITNLQDYYSYLYLVLEFFVN